MRSKCYRVEFSVDHYKESEGNLSASSNCEGFHWWCNVFAMQKSYEGVVKKDFIGGEVAAWEMLKVMRIQKTFKCMRYKND